MTEPTDKPHASTSSCATESTLLSVLEALAEGNEQVYLHKSGSDVAGPYSAHDLRLLHAAECIEADDRGTIVAYSLTDTGRQMATAMRSLWT